RLAFAQAARPLPPLSPRRLRSPAAAVGGSGAAARAAVRGPARPRPFRSSDRWSTSRVRRCARQRLELLVHGTKRPSALALVGPRHLPRPASLRSLREQGGRASAAQ